MTILKIFGHTVPRKDWLRNHGYTWDKGMRAWLKTIATCPANIDEIKAASANVKGCVAMASEDGNNWREIWRSKTYAEPSANRVGSARDEYGTAFGDHDYL